MDLFEASYNILRLIIMIMITFPDIYATFEARPKRTIENDMSVALDSLTNLPTLYSNPKRLQERYKGNKQKCAYYPNLYDIKFNNIYWQTLITTNASFYLFNAFLDMRKSSKIGPAIRIVAMIDKIEPKMETNCQIWFTNNKEPITVRTYEYKYIWNPKWGNYKDGILQPYLIACQIPKNYHKIIPESVSLVGKKCENATNNLRVIYDVTNIDDKNKKNFAVCVKGLDFYHKDISIKLIEWIELLFTLGVDKIHFYELNVHENVTKVLNQYRQRGKIEITPITLPGFQPNSKGLQHLYLINRRSHKRQNEVIAYNDCLYKNMYNYHYIVLLDVDEVIIPLRQPNWIKLMDAISMEIKSNSAKKQNASYTSFDVRNVYFFDDLVPSAETTQSVPWFTHMLQHVKRSRVFTKAGHFVKCFHNPEKVVILHNHYPLACLGQNCSSYSVPVEEAQLQHYRSECDSSLQKVCKEYKANTIEDKTIWRYKNQLIDQTYYTMKMLKFI